MNYRYNEVFRKLEKPEGMGSEGVSCEVIGGEVMRINLKFKLKVVKFEVNFHESQGINL